MAAGQFRLPVANAFGEPGFHEVLAASHTLEADLGTTAGRMLVVELRDTSRPEQTCGSHHPLSGCATVDWSDALGRPKVPAGGVFDNSVTVELESGPRTFYLSESGALNDEPDRFDPS